MSYPYCYKGNSSPFSTFWRWNIPPKSGVGVSNWWYRSECLPDGGVWWVLWQPLTSSIGGCVRYSTVAPTWPLKWSAKWTHFVSLLCLLSPWRPPGQYGAGSRRWRRTVASGIALDMLHWVMPSVSQSSTAIAIEMASNGGTFVRCCHLFCLIKT